MNRIINDDVLKGLAQVPDNSVTIIVTSPPYNVGISYGQLKCLGCDTTHPMENWPQKGPKKGQCPNCHQVTKTEAVEAHADEQPYVDYIKWLASIWKECYRVLRKGGRLIINIDAMTNRQSDKAEEYIRDIRTDIANDLKPIGFKFFGEHVWYKSSKDPSHNGGQFNGKKTAWGSYMSPSTPAVRRNHEYILVYSKEQFKLERQEGVSGEPDITGPEFQTYIASVWWMNAETRNIGNHPVPFPEELPYRCIKLYSYPGDTVLDIFNGVGTTTLVASRTKRQYIGIDMSADYCKFAEERIGEENIL